MSVPGDRLLVTARGRINVAGEAALLQCCPICIGKLVCVSQLVQRTAIGELLKPRRKKILSGHLSARHRINCASRDALSAERVPGKIDGRQTDRGDIVGERFMIDPGDDPLALPALRYAKSFVASPGLDVNQPVADLLRVSADPLDEPNSPGG